MNWQHFRAILWLHWRLRSNRRKRAGVGSAIIETIVSFVSIAAGGVTFLIGLFVGLWALREASAPVVMLVWDGFILAFLFVWQTELMTELQRSEVLSFDKFLHLPVSLSGVFLLNYVASFFSISVNLFLPAMTGLSIGLVFSKGPAMLLLFPMVAALFLMITALTYQFRGWLASLMENKRRRRNIVTVVTIVFVLAFQIPNLLTWMRVPSQANTKALQAETAKLDRLLATHQIDFAEYQQQTAAIYKKYGIRRQVPGTTGRQEVERIATIANKFIPPGWVAYGAMASLQGRPWPAILSMMGLTLIGSASLFRSYRTTMRLYTGHFTSQARVPAAVGARPDDLGRRRAAATFVEKSLPWVSEHASAIALSSFRSLTRAPEAKMMLLTPLIFTIVFGSIFLRSHSNPGEFGRPLMASGAMVLILFGLSQLAGNQFGLDRSGFRVWVLSPASRKDILLGKNIALLPFAVGLGSVATVVLQLVYPMRLIHFVGILVQMASMYLLFCILSNFLSMLAPMPFPSGAHRPARMTGMAILPHLAFMVLFPAIMGTTLIPLAIEFLLSFSGWGSRLPVYLPLALVELAVIAFLYWRILGLQGSLLQDREQRILEIVTSKVD